MEYYQSTQNRASETAAVINQYLPDLTVGGVTSAMLISRAAGLGDLAQTRDDALAAFDAANNAENQGFLAIRSLTLALPKAADGELDDEIPAESALLDLYSAAYSITPRTTELALQRGKKLVSAITKTNTYLAAQTPARPPITNAGKGIVELTAALAAQPALEQAEEDRAADARAARTDLRVAATALDRLNKRFYARLLGEARENPALATGLAQITTDSRDLPGTLGIKSILQGGEDNLHLLVSYDNGTFDSANTNAIEWMIAGVDHEFTHSAPADPSGNALGPFTPGQTIKLRTRVTNANGTTTGSTRTLVILAV